MKLRRLEIKKLHGVFNYDIIFNDDITFLYGKNGCGKTTILNIISYIITCDLSKLFNYTFTYITLIYDLQSTKSENITLRLKDNKLYFDLNNKNILFLDNNLGKTEEEDEKFNYYLKRNPVLQDIRRKFNIAYLPLNRVGIDLSHNLNDYLSQRNFYYADNKKLYYKNDNKLYNTDTALSTVNEIIRQNYSLTVDKISNLDRNLRDEIINSIFKVDDDYLKSKQLPDKDTLKMKLTHLNLFNDTLKVNFENFYYIYNKTQNEFHKVQEFTDITELQDISELQDTINGMMYLKSKVFQLNLISNMYDELDKQKKHIMSPIAKFTQLVNSFFQDSAIVDSISVNSNGMIFECNKCKDNIKPDMLSSGEKQIVIFLAYLIFVLSPQKQPLFIIDEPELSLHLAWQKKLVGSVLEATDDIQLIFATHSPEIIGRYKSKTFNVVPAMEE